MRPAWLPAVSATLLIRTVGTFMSRTIPVVAPRMTADPGVPPETVVSTTGSSTLP